MTCLQNLDQIQLRGPMCCIQGWRRYKENGKCTDIAENTFASPEREYLDDLILTMLFSLHADYVFFQILPTFETCNRRDETGAQQPQVPSRTVDCDQRESAKTSAKLLFVARTWNIVCLIENNTDTSS